MVKKLKAKYIAIVAAVVIIAITLGIILYKAAGNEFEKIHTSNPVSLTATVIDTESVKSAPYSFSFSKGKVEKGQNIRLLAEKNGWYKVIYTEGSKISNGFIKKDSLSDIKDSSIPAYSLELDKNKVFAVSGEEVTLSATLSPSYSNEEIQWSSSNKAVATVENGNVNVVGVGKAVITAKIANDEKTAVIVCTGNEENFKFDKHQYSLKLGEKMKLSEKLGNISNSKIEWTTSDKSVVSVENGTIKANGAGAAIISASADGNVATCRIRVTNANENAKSYLDIVNSYGNVYNYHPSVYYFENGFNGYKYWCAYTPYERCNDKWENPHIAVSNDLKNWTTPKGFSNPLEPIPVNYERGVVYNSDTEILYNTKTGTLECWWRFYDKPNKRIVLRRKTTTDGVKWTATEDMYIAQMGKWDFLSPALIFEDGIYKMWAINPFEDYAVEYKESTDGKNWSSARSIKINYEDKELANWHLDVIHTAKGYEMCISSYYPETNDRLHMDLYYSYSPDNINYSQAELLFSPTRNTSKWDNQGLYRSSLLYADGKYYLFYSGVNTEIGPSGLGMVSGNNPFTMS